MKSPLRLLLNVIKPINLLLACLAYLLGVSIAKYLGITLNSIASVMGGCLIICILSASYLLNMYFSKAYQYPSAVEMPKDRDTFRRLLFYTAIGFLAISAVTAFYLIASGLVHLPALLLLVIYLVISLVFAIPPIRLVDRGFGELSLALLIAGLPELIAFSLQGMNIHRLVIYLSFPLVFLALAYLLVLDFPPYSADQKFGNQTLLVRLTWERAVPVHNVFLTTTYLIFAAAPLFGIPYNLIWAPLLTLPLAIYQIVILRNITLGLKPSWSILTLNATALIGLTIYLLMFTFWLR
jgi:1,4-dihydroxy-2-naphthoate octaprenyltransferase